MRASRSVLAWLVISACDRSEDTTRPVTPVIENRAPVVPSPRPERTVQQLQEQCVRFATLVEAKGDDALPGLGSAEYVDPPRESELVWSRDRSIAVGDRIPLLLGLHEGCKRVMKRYGARDLAKLSADPERAGDSAETLQWSGSVIRIMGHVIPIFIDEFLPTLDKSKPDYAVRLGGMDKVRVGAFGTLQGSLISLNARRAPLEARRQLAAVWQEHAPRYAAAWLPPQCTQLVAWSREVIVDETDVAIRGALDKLIRELETCEARK